jgi:GAF domain-containing protein
VSEISREPGLCGSAILSDETLVIPDTLTDPVACSNGLVAGPMAVRFYAAAPITTHDGHRLGTVNILDTKPRLITEDDTATLADLAAIVLDALEVRLSALNALRAEQERRHEQEEARQRAERDTAAIQAFASGQRPPQASTRRPAARAAPDPSARATVTSEAGVMAYDRRSPGVARCCWPFLPARPRGIRLLMAEA